MELKVLSVSENAPTNHKIVNLGGKWLGRHFQTQILTCFSALESSNRRAMTATTIEDVQVPKTPVITATVRPQNVTGTMSLK
jgi:hypothetical protein